MPWTSNSFREKFNKNLTPSQAKKAASIANAILSETGDEGKAIRIANSKFKRKRKKKDLGWTDSRREADGKLRGMGYD